MRAGLPDEVAVRALHGKAYPARALPPAADLHEHYHLLLTWTCWEELTRAIWASVPPEPVEANFPLFVIYTSGARLHSPN